MKTYARREVTHVVSEPGDCTRYDYFVYRDEDDVFHFMPHKSPFNFPQQIPLWNLDDDSIGWISEKFECNPCTVAECMRTMREMINE